MLSNLLTIDHSMMCRLSVVNVFKRKKSQETLMERGVLDGHLQIAVLCTFPTMSKNKKLLEIDENNKTFHSFSKALTHPIYFNCNTFIK